MLVPILRRLRHRRPARTALRRLRRGADASDRHVAESRRTRRRHDRPGRRRRRLEGLEGVLVPVPYVSAYGIDVDEPFPRRHLRGRPALVPILRRLRHRRPARTALRRLRRVADAPDRCVAEPRRTRRRHNRLGRRRLLLKGVELVFVPVPRAPIHGIDVDNDATSQGFRRQLPLHAFRRRVLDDRPSRADLTVLRSAVDLVQLLVVEAGTSRPPPDGSHPLKVVHRVCAVAGVRIDEFNAEVEPSGRGLRRRLPLDALPGCPRDRRPPRAVLLRLRLAVDASDRRVVEPRRTRRRHNRLGRRRLLLKGVELVFVPVPRAPIHGIDVDNDATSQGFRRQLPLHAFRRRVLDDRPSRADLTVLRSAVDLVQLLVVEAGTSRPPPDGSHPLKVVHRVCAVAGVRIDEFNAEVEPSGRGLRRRLPLDALPGCPRDRRPPRAVLLRLRLAVDASDRRVVEPRRTRRRHNRLGRRRLGFEGVQLVLVPLPRAPTNGIDVDEPFPRSRCGRTFSLFLPPGL